MGSRFWPPRWRRCCGACSMVRGSGRSRRTGSLSRILRSLRGRPDRARCGQRRWWASTARSQASSAPTRLRAPAMLPLPSSVPLQGRWRWLPVKLAKSRLPLSGWAVGYRVRSVFPSTGTTWSRARVRSSRFLNLAGTGDSSGMRTSPFPTRPTPRLVASYRTSSSTLDRSGSRPMWPSRWRSSSRSPSRVWERRSMTRATERIGTLTAPAWASSLETRWGARSRMTTWFVRVSLPSRRP